MSMRLSGNYFERLLINVIPWTLFGSLIIYFARGNFKTTLITFFISTAAFWLMDTLVIYFKFKNPKTLRYNNSLLLGDQAIAINDIDKITPVIDKRYRWSFRMIEFSFRNGDTSMVIDKSQTIISDFTNKPSKTITRLVTIYPELKSKISITKNI